MTDSVLGSSNKRLVRVDLRGEAPAAGELAAMFKDVARAISKERQQMFSQGSEVIERAQEDGPTGWKGRSTLHFDISGQGLAPEFKEWLEQS